MGKNIYKIIILSFILFLALQIVSLPAKSFIKSKLDTFYGNSSFLEQKIDGKNNLFFTDFYTNGDSVKDFLKIIDKTSVITFFIFMFLICGVIGVFKEKDGKILVNFFKYISLFWGKSLILFLLYLPLFLIFTSLSFILSKKIFAQIPSNGKILPFIYGLLVGAIFFFIVRFFYTLSKIALVSLNISPIKSFILPFKNIGKLIKKTLLIYILYLILLAGLNLIIIKFIGKGISQTSIYILIEFLIFLKFTVITATYGKLTQKIEEL